jgi:hypothetical protein
LVDTERYAAVQVEAVDGRAEQPSALDTLRRRREMTRERNTQLDHGSTSHAAESHALRDGTFVAGRERRAVLGKRVIRAHLEQAEPAGRDKSSARTAMRLPAPGPLTKRASCE